jgi:UDP-glucose 4-epimerase
LLGRGDEVRVLDNFSTGKRENLEGLDLDLIVGDICDLETVQSAMAGVDRVFHLAAQVSVTESMLDPIRSYATNLGGTVNVLSAARKAGVERVVLASSCAVYGDAVHPVAEDEAPKPLSPYADSKLSMEHAADLFKRAFGLATVSLRYFNVYGPRQSPESDYAAVIPIFIDKMLSHNPPLIHGDGKQTRNFVFVKDVVRANLLAAENDISGSFNIGGERSVSILDLVQALSGMIADSPEWEFGPPRAGDIRHSAAVMDAAAEALGYRPEVVLEQGLQQTVQWFERKMKKAN